MNAKGQRAHNSLLFCCAMLFFGADTQAQNLFVGDFNTNIYQFTPAGAQSTFATGFNQPFGLAFDRAGMLFEADWGSGNIYKIKPDGTKTIFASGLVEPAGMAFDRAGNLFVANEGSGTITKISTNGTQTVFASGLNDAFGLAFDRAGNLYVANILDVSGNISGYIYKYTPGGTQTTFSSGGSPVGLAFDSAGDLFVANAYSNTVTEIATNGTQSVFATLYNPWALTFDCQGNLFVVDGNGGNVMKITADGTTTTNFSGLSSPLGLAFQPLLRLSAKTKDAAFQLTVSMPSPYCSTVVQASTDLVSWSPIVTNTPPFTVTDSMASSRFYRALLCQ
jgi:streptogramin lyase